MWRHQLLGYVGQSDRELTLSLLALKTSGRSPEAFYFMARLAPKTFLQKIR